MSQNRERALIALAQAQVSNTRSGLLRLTQNARELLGVDRAGVWWYRKETASLECLDLFDCLRNSHYQGFSWSSQPNSEYFARLARERWVAIDEISQEPTLKNLARSNYAQQFPIRALLNIPTHTEAGFTGLLALEYSDPHRWNPEEISLAVNLAYIAAINFERLLRKQAEEALKIRECRN